MAWESVAGQEHILQMLKRSIATDRIPQALLLTGSEGCGTLAIAVAFARVVNCETLRGKGLGSIDPSDVEACGTCRACIQARTLQHPNITLITALPSGKAGVESELAPAALEELTELKLGLAEDPYVELQMTGATQIRISQIREIKRSLAMSSVQSGRRVVIINRVETMTTEAANAFLKTLEEPHDDVTLILTTSRPEQLLPTIVSRCQELMVPPLDDELVVQALVESGACEREEASLIAPFAEGSIVTAKAFLAEDVQADREEAVTLLRSALKGGGFRIALSSAVASVAEGRDRNRAIMILSLLAVWLRDARSLSMAGDNAVIANADQQDALERFVSRFGLADFDQVLDLIEAGVRDIRRNVTISTVLTTTMLSIRKVLAKAPKPATEVGTQ